LADLNETQLWTFKIKISKIQIKPKISIFDEFYYNSSYVIHYIHAMK